MDPVPVDSTAFTTIQFNEQDNTVTVTFKSGGSATAPCDKSTYDEFLASDSKGRFWHQRLKTI